MISVGVGASLVLSGCATASKKNPTVAVDPKVIREALRQDMTLVQPSRVSTDSGNQEMVVLGVKLENTQFDFPVEINSRVEYWVNYFTGKGRGHFERYLERSEFFIPYIRPLLRAHNMPEDLVYLAMIESGFNNHARSSAKAVGPWQFITWTGRRYGLEVNWWVDERRDTHKSTLAAVNYLKDLYSIFGTWELAAAAYNAGEAKIARAIRRFGTKDFWVIGRHRFLRPETRDYVPKIMAAAIVAKNRKLFGFNSAPAQIHEGEVLAADGQVVKVEARDPEEITSEEDVLADEYVGAPDEDMTPAAVAATRSPNDIRNTLPVVRVPTVNRQGHVSGEHIEELEVEGPADLLKVARAAGLSYQTVKALNPEILRWCTPPTAKSYRLKLPSSAKERFLATYNHEAFPRKVEFLVHKVRRGETVDRIARHFGIKPEPVAELNGIHRSSYLRSGATVLLPMPNDRSRSLASLDLRDAPDRRRARAKRKKAIYRVSLQDRAMARAPRSVN
jgi:hypothetical protein